MGRVSSPFTMLWRPLFGGSKPEPADSQDEPVQKKPKERPAQKASASGWNLPSTELLNKGESQPVPPTILQQMSQQIEKALADHRIDVEVDDVRTGPRIIQFGLVPGWVKLYRNSKSSKSGANEPSSEDASRVKVQDIVARQTDLALALKTPYLRIEAPVPGEALVGLEVPNPCPRSVVLRSVVESEPFQKIAAKNGLPVALGEDTAGEPVAARPQWPSPPTHRRSHRQRKERLHKYHSLVPAPDQRARQAAHGYGGPQASRAYAL